MAKPDDAIDDEAIVPLLRRVCRRLKQRYRIREVRETLGRIESKADALIHTHVEGLLDLAQSTSQGVAALRQQLGEFMAATNASLIAALAAINDSTNTLSEQMNGISTDIDKVVTNEQAQLELIQSLRDQIAAGSPVTQAQLDELETAANARVAALQGVIAVSSAAGPKLAAIAADPNDSTGGTGGDTGGGTGGGGNAEV